MPGWENSDRRSRLPADWSRIRKRIFKRDGHQCTHTFDGVRCPERATDVDHVRRGDDHRDSNLTSLCSDHHRAKSAREGAEARREKQREIGRRFRRHDPHPSEVR